MLVRVTSPILKKQYLSVKPCILTEFVNAFFDKRHNALEVWLKDQGYSDKLLRGKILKGRKFSRLEVLKKQKSKKR